MPCFKRNKRSRSDNSEENHLNEDNGNGTLHKILRRVSFLSSTIIRFLRDIRDDILRLFDLQEVVSEKHKTSNESEQIMNKTVMYCKGGVDLGFENFAAGDSPKLRRAALSDPVRVELKHELNDDIYLEIKNKEATNYHRSGQMIEHCIIPEGYDCVCSSQNHETKRNQQMRDEAIHNVKVEIAKKGCVAPKGSFEKVKDTEQKGNVRERNEFKDGITYDYSLKTLLESVGGKCRMDNQDIQDHSLDCRVRADQNGLVTIQKHVKPTEFKDIDEKAFTEIVAGTPQPNSPKTVTKDQPTSDQSGYRSYETGITQDFVQDSLIGSYQESSPIATCIDGGIIPATNSEKKRTSCQPVSQTNNQLIGPGAATPQNLPEIHSSFAGARPKTSGASRKVQAEGKSGKGKIMKRFEKFFRRDSTKKLSETEKDPMLEQTENAEQEEEIPTEQQPLDYLITDRIHLQANEEQLASMVEEVFKHCIHAFRIQHYKFRLILVVRVNMELNGHDGSAPQFDLGNLGGGKPGKIAVTFVSRFRLNTLVNRTGEQLEIDALLEMLKMNTTISHNGPPNSVKCDGDLRWCANTMHLMVYICYYVLVDKNVTLERVHGGTVSEDKRILVLGLLEKDMLRRFDKRMSSLTPRMRHAIEKFSIDHDFDGPIGDDQNKEGPSEKTVPTTKPTPKKKKKNRSARRAKSKYRKSQDAATMSQNTPLCDDIINEVNDEDLAVNETSNLISYNDDTQYTRLVVEDIDENEEPKADIAVKNVGVPPTLSTSIAATEQVQQLSNSGDITHEGSGDAPDACALEYDDIADNEMHTMFTADTGKEIEWDFADYVTYIETNNTLDYSCLEVMAGHGERPNKKKICEKIKEKVKTKGIPNKHLDKNIHIVETYYALGNWTDDSGDKSDNADDTAVLDEIDAIADNENNDNDKEKEQEKDIEDNIVQIIDDREFNFVPEVVLRKEESKLKDLEEAYVLSSAEKKKETPKKKREKRQKAVKTLEFFQL